MAKNTVTPGGVTSTRSPYTATPGSKATAKAVATPSTASTTSSTSSKTPKSKAEIKEALTKARPRAWRGKK